MALEKRGLVLFASTVLILSLVSALFAADAAAPAPAAAPAVAPSLPAAPAVESSAVAPVVESSAAVAAAPVAPAEMSVVQLPKGVVATVNGDSIGEDEWIGTLKRVAGPGILEVMIRHKLVRQAAAKRGIAITDQESQAAFDKAVTQAGGMDKLIANLSEMGERIEDYRERLKTEALLRKLVEDTVTVSDDDIHKLYLEQYGRKAEVQVIARDTQSEADQVVKDAKAGSDFSDMASRLSSDAYTARNHGYLPMPLTDGFFPKPYGDIDITQPMAEAIFNLKPGEVSGVMPSIRSGFYIFKVVSVMPANTDVKLETVKEDVRIQAREMKISRAAAQYLDSLLSTADIRVGIK